MSKPVILAVDDDPQVLAAIRRDLREHYRSDYSVIAARSGEEALEAVRQLKARGDELALVLSDQRMPGLSGVEVLAACREIYRLARRVLLTAYSDIGAAVRAINEAHLDYYLSKPWDPPEERLYPVIDDLLDAWQVERVPAQVGLRLVGDQWSPRSHAIKNFLGANLIPYRWIDYGRDPDAQALCEATGVTREQLPALFLEDGSVLRNPDIVEIARTLQLSTEAAHELYDLAIVGAGPAGLAAAVYGASEGLRTVILDAHAPGGQAGTSARIENYLGFPAGVSGSELARRAVTQAQRLGAEVLAPIRVESVTVEAGYKRLTLGDGRVVVARALLATTGMVYRDHPADGITTLSGAGVYHGASTTEGTALAGRRVMVVGGGNSAGQAALYLSRFAGHVDIVIRRDSLKPTMSQYLIDQIDASPRIDVRAMTVIERVEGEGRLERVHLASSDNGTHTVEEVDAVFIFIGTRPQSDWLPGEVLRDSKGFVVTGRDLAACAELPRLWKEQREPFLLETSVPGLFAAGDVRAGAMNRVASAVGEGSMAVRMVHAYLATT
ncbi:MAG TPA: FAD-dependent oxidoreductase [Candidatus Eisenbacteria bacterium]